MHNQQVVTTHPSFNYTLEHMSIGGGIAVAAIAAASAFAAWAFFRYAMPWQ